MTSTSSAHDSARAQQIVEQFGLPVRGEPRLLHVARGAVGTVDRLETGIDAYAVKSFFWPVDLEAVGREVEFRNATERAGIRSPRNVAAPDGRILVRLPETTELPNVRLYSWVDGLPLAASTSGAEAAIRLLARLHVIALVTDDRPDPWYEVVPEIDAWCELTGNARRARAPWADRLDDALGRIDDLRRLIRPSAASKRQMCHLDIQPSNVLGSGEGPVVIDWDNAGPGVPSRELASFLAEWATPADPGDTAPVADLMAVYRDAGGPARLTGIDDFSMHLATRLNFIFVQAELALDRSAGEDHRTRADDWVAVGLENLPESHRLADVLEIVRGA